MKDKKLQWNFAYRWNFADTSIKETHRYFLVPRDCEPAPEPEDGLPGARDQIHRLNICRSQLR